MKRYRRTSRNYASPVSISTAIPNQSWFVTQPMGGENGWWWLNVCCSYIWRHCHRNLEHKWGRTFTYYYNIRLSEIRKKIDAIQIKVWQLHALTDNPLRMIIRLKQPTDECISHLTLVGFCWFTAMNQELQERAVHIAVSQWASLIAAYLFTYSLICSFIVYLFIYILICLFINLYYLFMFVYLLLIYTFIAFYSFTYQFIYVYLPVW